MAEMQDIHDTAVETETDKKTTPNSPQLSLEVTRSVLRNSQPPDGRGIAKEGSQTEQEGMLTCNEAHTCPQSARVTPSEGSATKAGQHTPAPAEPAELFEAQESELSAGGQRLHTALIDPSMELADFEVAAGEDLEQLIREVYQHIRLHATGEQLCDLAQLAYSQGRRVLDGQADLEGLFSLLLAAVDICREAAEAAPEQAEELQQIREGADLHLAIYRYHIAMQKLGTIHCKTYLSGAAQLAAEVMGRNQEGNDAYLIAELVQHFAEFKLKIIKEGAKGLFPEEQYEEMLVLIASAQSLASPDRPLLKLAAFFAADAQLTAGQAQMAQHSLSELLPPQHIAAEQPDLLRHRMAPIVREMSLGDAAVSAARFVKSGSKEEENNLQEAVLHLRRAVEGSIALQNDIDISTREKEWTTLFEIQHRAYVSLADCLVQLANGADGKYEEALAIAEGAKGLAMLHLLQEKRLQPELQLTEFDPKVPMATLHQLQVALKHSGAALAVEYVIAADVLLTFTMDCDGQVTASRIIPTLDYEEGDSLNKLVLRLTSVMSTKANALGPSSSHTRNDPDLQADLEILSALLVGPAQPELQKKLNDLPPDSEIVFIPVSPLHLVPFPALFLLSSDYAENEPASAPTMLVDKFAISLSPSIRALTRCAERIDHLKGDPAVERENVCVVGNPMGDLPHAADEARSVKRCYNGAYSSPILGVSAVKDRVISAMGRSSVIHLALHSSWDARKAPSGCIQLAKGEVLTGDEVLAKWGPGKEDTLVAFLTVLSSCESAFGKEYADGVRGFPYALLLSGCPCIVQSLWRVQDSSTKTLMKSFHEELVWNDRNVAQALRQAMLHMRPTHHPALWAAFIPYGLASVDLQIRGSDADDLIEAGIKQQSDATRFAAELSPSLAQKVLRAPWLREKIKIQNASTDTVYVHWSTQSQSSSGEPSFSIQDVSVKGSSNTTKQPRADNISGRISVRGKASKSDNIIEEIPIPKGFACIYVSLAKKKDDGKFYLFAHNLHCEEGMIYTIDDDERFLNEKGYTDEEFLADNLEGKRSLPNQEPRKGSTKEVPLQPADTTEISDEVFFTSKKVEEAESWIRHLLRSQQEYAAFAFDKVWIETLKASHPELHDSIESQLMAGGFACILDCDDSRWYKSVTVEATGKHSKEGLSLTEGLQWIGGVISKKASSLLDGKADAGSGPVVALSDPAAPEKEEECAPRQCCLATSAPSTVEAELATGEAASTGSFSRFSFRGSLNRQHEFNLHVNLSCCATRDEVHVKLTHLEGQLAVPDMDGHKFGVTNVKVQLHARAHKRPQPASPLQLSVVNLDEPLFLDKHEVPCNRYSLWRAHTWSIVTKVTNSLGVPVPTPELTWECKPDKVQVGEQGKWVAVVKLQTSQQSINTRLPGLSTVELVRSMDNTWLTDASSSGARGVCWSTTTKPVKLAARAVEARKVDVSLSVHVSAMACYINASNWHKAMAPIMAAKYSLAPIDFPSSVAEVRLLTAA